MSPGHAAVPHCLAVWVAQAFQHQGSEIWISVCTAQLLSAQHFWIPELGMPTLEKPKSESCRVRDRDLSPCTALQMSTRSFCVCSFVQSETGPSGK